MKKILATFLMFCLINPYIVMATDSHSADWGLLAYGTATDNATLDIGASEDFTFEVWYRPADSPMGNIRGQGTIPYDSNTFGAKWQTLQTREYEWEYGYDGSNYEICISTTDDNGASTENVCQNITQLTLNTWYYIAVTYDDATGAYVFYKGDEATCPTSQGAGDGTGQGINAGTSRFSMAFGDNSSGTNADGLFAEYRIWRTERTATEISDNYEPESIASGTGLLEVWKFNNVWTAEINGNTLTTVNSPSFTTTKPTITANCGGYAPKGRTEIVGARINEAKITNQP